MSASPAARLTEPSGADPGNWWCQLTPTPVHRRLGLVCLSVGMQGGGQAAIGPRTLDHHGVVILQSGSFWFSWAGQTAVQVAAPATLWLTPGVEHRYGTDDAGGSQSTVEFGGPSVRAYAELGFIVESNPVVPLSSAEPARRIIRKMAWACREAGPHQQVMLAAGVHELLVALQRGRAARGPDPQTVLKALARQATLPIPIREHARRLSLTQEELRTAVRRAGGSTPHSVILNTRLNLAKELLATTDLKVTAIARRTGYSDAAYFTRLFRRHVGMAPTSFREQHGRSG